MSRTLPTSSKATVRARVGSAEVTLELELQLEQPLGIGLPVYRWTATMGDTERTGICEVDRRPDIPGAVPASTLARGDDHAVVSAIETSIIAQLLADCAAGRVVACAPWPSSTETRSCRGR